MAERIELRWPNQRSDGLSRRVHALIRAVSGLGGAIGWHSPPPQAETDPWLQDVLDAVTTGNAALCLAYADGDIAAMGLWKRHEAHFFQHMAELAKIMTHPRARGLGLGAMVTQALIDNATAAGIETLQLGVRGNNHLAIELYEQLGFQEWGRLPNVIEIGHERFDDVRMFLDLGRPPHLVLHGHAPCGPGSSPAQRPRSH